MWVDCRVFWLQKSGLDASEYEDAYAPHETCEVETTEFCCAVADGATETSFSGLWANILVDGYVDGVESLSDMQARWLAQVSGKNLPWYAEQKLESGAYAALVGLTIRSNGADEGPLLSWSAKAVGDSCLFHTRKTELLRAFPLDHWELFNNAPVLLPSRPIDNGGIAKQAVISDGSCVSGDVFYLMSDAISNWFLRRCAEKQDGIELLEGLSTQQDFERLVAGERVIKDQQGSMYMPNDDVTFMRVAVADAGPQYPAVSRNGRTSLTIID